MALVDHSAVEEDSEASSDLKLKLRQITKPGKLIVFMKDFLALPIEDLSPTVLSLAMSRCVVFRLYDDCLACFRKLQELDAEIPVRSYKNAMIAMNSRGMSKDVLSLYKTMKPLAKRPPHRVLQEFIKANKAVSNIDDLSRAFSESLNHGRHRKLNDFTALARRAITCSEFAKIDTITSKMRSAGFHHFDTVHLNTVLRAYAIQGKWKEALKLLEDSFKSPVAVCDSSQVKSFHNSFSITSNGMVSRMLPCRPNAQSYALVMRACSVAGHVDKALHVHQDLIRGLSVDETAPESASLFRELAQAHYKLGHKGVALNIIKRSIASKHFSSVLLSEGLKIANEVGDLTATMHLLESYARVAFTYKTEKSCQIEERNAFQIEYAAAGARFRDKKKKIKMRHKDRDKLSDNADDGIGGLNKEDALRRSIVRQSKLVSNQRRAIEQGLSLAGYRKMIKMQKRKRQKIQYLVRGDHVGMVLNNCLEVANANVNDPATQNLAKNTALRSLRIANRLCLELNDSHVSFLLRNDLYLLGSKGIKANADATKTAISDYNLMVHDNRVMKVWKYAVTGLRHHSQNPYRVASEEEIDRRDERNGSMIKLLHSLACSHLNDANNMMIVFRNAFHHGEVNDDLFESLMTIISNPFNRYLSRPTQSGRLRMLLSPKMKKQYKRSIKQKMTGNDDEETRTINPVQQMIVDLMGTKKSERISFPPKIGLMRLSSHLAVSGMAENVSMLLHISRQSIIKRLSLARCYDVRGIEVLDPLIMFLNHKYLVSLANSQYWQQTGERTCQFLSLIERMISLYEYNPTKISETFKPFPDLFPNATETLELSMNDLTAIIKSMINKHADIDQAMQIYRKLKSLNGINKSLIGNENSPNWTRTFGRFKINEAMCDVLVRACLDKASGEKKEDMVSEALELCVAMNNQANATNKEGYKATCFIPLLNFILTNTDNQQQLFQFVLDGLKLAVTSGYEGVIYNGVAMHPIRIPNPRLLSMRAMHARQTINTALDMANATQQEPSVNKFVQGLGALLSSLESVSQSVN